MKSVPSLAGKPLYHLPPTAVPLNVKDLGYAITSLVNPGKSIKKFLIELEEKTGNPNCFLTDSGRSALAIILFSLKRTSKRSKVILPAYTCPTVAQAIQKAGLIPVFCDVDPQTLDMDRRHLNDLIDDDTLSIIPTHLYGLALDISDLVEVGEEQDIVIIEDAAQSFGAVFDGKMVGNTGDLGFFSMGRGKSLPAGQGGFILTKDRYLDLIMETVQELITSANKPDFASITNYLALGIATTPFGWWFIHRSRLNPAHDGMDLENLPPINMGSLSATQAGIGTSILQRIDRVNAERQRNAYQLIEWIKSIEWISLPKIPAKSEPVFLRLPIIPDTKDRSERLFTLLSEAGVGVSRSYYRTVPQMFLDRESLILENFPGATHLAECLITIPTHPYVRGEDLKRVKKILEYID